jgi:hypothetical protein
MSAWWAWRVLWLVLGLLTGVIAFLPESAKTATGIVAGVFIVAVMVLLGRWAYVTVAEKIKAAMAKPETDTMTLVDHEIIPGASLKFEARAEGGAQPGASKDETELSEFKVGGYQFRTVLNTEEEKIEPRKKALMWDSVLFGGAIIACAALASAFA